MLIAARNGMMAGKSILPPGARWVEYLESTGMQWIDTGVSPIYYTDKFWCTLMFTGGVGGTIFGVKSDNEIAAVVSPANTLWFKAFNTGVALAYNQSPDWNGVKFILGYEDSYSYVMLAGASSRIDQQYIVSQNSVTMSIAIFRRNGVPNTNSRGRAFDFRFERDGKIIKHLVPIAIGTTGYMLDLVSGEYLQYGNRGTGSFVIGPDASAPAGGGYKRKCVRRSYRRSARPSARFRSPSVALAKDGWRTPLWKEVA